MVNITLAVAPTIFPLRWAFWIVPLWTLLMASSDASALAVALTPVGGGVFVLGMFRLISSRWVEKIILRDNTVFIQTQWDHFCKRESGEQIAEEEFFERLFSPPGNEVVVLRPRRYPRLVMFGKSMKLTSEGQTRLSTWRRESNIEPPEWF